MITMDFDQAADFFGEGPIPANVIVLPRAEVDAQIVALIAA